MSYYATKPAAPTLQTSGIPKKVGPNDFPKTAGSYSRTADNRVHSDQGWRDVLESTRNLFRRSGSQSTAARQPQIRNFEQMQFGGGYGPEYNLYQPPTPLYVNRNEFRQATPQVPPAIDPVSTPAIRRQPLRAPVFAPAPAQLGNTDPRITHF